MHRSKRLVIYLLNTVSLNSPANLVLLALKFWENMTRWWNTWFAPMFAALYEVFDTMILF